MKNEIKTLMMEFWERETQYKPREKLPKELIISNSSIVIIGPRRAGKSYTINQIRDMILEEDKKRNCIYINFEDERLSRFSEKDFNSILEAYYEIRKDKPILLLDEMQNVDGWEKFLRRLADSGYKVVATGSNSRMLSREIADKLGGRFAETEIYPLDFKEFLAFKGMPFKEEFFYSKTRFEIKRYFEEYFLYGGFPEVALLPEKESKIKILKSYFNLVFYKDLIARKGIQNEEILRFIIKKLRENIGNLITPRAIYGALKNAEIEASPNTVEKYIDYLEEAFLVIPCLPFAKSVVKQVREKRYIIDNGYIKLLEIKEDKGLLLENLIFNELTKKGKKVNYHLGKKECDFIIDDNEALQVAYELNEANVQRELEGIMEAVEVYGLKKARIVTNDDEKEIKLEGMVVQVTPAWKWCLSL